MGGSVRVVVFNNATFNNISAISSDFLKFVFILLDIGPAPRNILLDSEFLPDLHFLCKIVLKPSNVIPLLIF